MTRAALLIACAFTLAACNSEPEVNARNASVEEVAQKVRDAGGSDSFVRAGKWESRVRIEEFSMPGAPPEMTASLRKMHEKAEVATSCLTEEDAKRPKEDFFAGTGKNCRYDHFNMGGGKIDARMNCSAQGMGQVMTMQGTYEPNEYQVRMSMKANAGGAPADGMTMRMRVDAKRVGNCDNKAA
jgi:hypothetical protein